jgi:hypothetical protein
MRRGHGTGDPELRKEGKGPMRLQLTIARLMGLVLFLGFWFAAMRSGSHLWLRVSWTLTASVLLASLILARYRGAFWYGFAIVGWGYFLLGQSPGDGTLNPWFLSSDLVEYLCSFVPQYRIVGLADALEIERSRNIEIICHSMLALIAASVGGLFALLIAARCRDDSSTDGPVGRVRDNGGASNG